MIYNSRNIVGLRFYTKGVPLSLATIIIKDNQKYGLEEYKNYPEYNAEVLITNLKYNIWIPIIPIITTKSWFRLKMMFK